MQALARRLAATAARPRRAWPSAPVPVSLVITELDVGGAEKALVSLATRLDRRRWAVNVVALGPDAPLAAPLRAAEVPVECLGISARHPLQAVNRLATSLRARQPALVQSFLFHANVATRLAALRNGFPRPWLVGGIRVAERQRRWHLALDRLTARLGCGAVCVSEGVRTFSQQTGGWSGNRLTVIPNAVDPAPYDRAAERGLTRETLGLADVPRSAFLALYVGRLHPQKGLSTLIEAAARVAASQRERPWHLALVGAGPERERLQRQVAAVPELNGRVHWLGHRLDVPELLHAADLLVLPSLWEGMPNVVLEAMAARRAVVATDVEGTGELVVEGETGWLVPAGNDEALAKALFDAASDPVRLAHFGQAARRRVETKFTPERTTEAYERLWAGLLGYEWPESATEPAVD